MLQAREPPRRIAHARRRAMRDAHGAVRRVCGARTQRRTYPAGVKPRVAYDAMRAAVRSGNADACKMRAAINANAARVRVRAQDAAPNASNAVRGGQRARKMRVRSAARLVRRANGNARTQCVRVTSARRAHMPANAWSRVRNAVLTRQTRRRSNSATPINATRALLRVMNARHDTVPA